MTTGSPPATTHTRAPPIAARCGAERAAYVVGLAMQLAPSVDRIAGRGGGVGGGVHCDTVVADHEIVGARQQWVARLDGFRYLSGRAAFEPVADRFRRAAPQSAAFEHAHCLGESRRISGGRSRTDRREIVLRHVGKDETQHARAAARPQQSPALYRREMAAHDIEFANRRARTEQRGVDRNLVRQRDRRGRSGHQRGRAATEREQQQVAGAGVAGDFERGLGGALR